MNHFTPCYCRCPFFNAPHFLLQDGTLLGPRLWSSPTYLWIAGGDFIIALKLWWLLSWRCLWYVSGESHMVVPVLYGIFTYMNGWFIWYIWVVATQIHFLFLPRTPYLPGEMINLTSIFLRWVVQPPTRYWWHNKLLSSIVHHEQPRRPGLACTKCIVYWLSKRIQ